MFFLLSARAIHESPAERKDLDKSCFLLLSVGAIHESPVTRTDLNKRLVHLCAAAFYISLSVVMMAGHGHISVYRVHEKLKNA